MIMKDLEQFLANSNWLYLRLNNGFFYKCRLIDLSETAATVLDRYGLVSVFALDQIEVVSIWKENNIK